MAEYHVTADDNRRFTATAGPRTIGALTYLKWFAFDATRSLAAQPPFQIKPKGFWGTTIELLQDGRLLLSFQMGWNGNIVIHTTFQGREQGFIFQQKGFFRNQFVLADAQHQQ